MQEKRPWANGWILVLWLSLAALALLVPFQWKWGLQDQGLRAGIRLSARISTLLFLCAFLAGPLFLFRKNPFTQWLLWNRRYLGVSFASVHTMHLTLILGLATVDPHFFSSLSAVGGIGGAVGYIFIYAMTATSSDAAVRWMGFRNWKILHRTGLYYLWVVFAFTYFGRMEESLFYVPIFLIFLGAMVFRLWILIKKRKTGER